MVRDGDDGASGVNVMIAPPSPSSLTSTGCISSLFRALQDLRGGDSPEVFGLGCLIIIELDGCCTWVSWLVLTTVFVRRERRDARGDREEG